MTRPPYLTKARFLAGRQCARRLWLSCHEASRATPPSAAVRVILDMGRAVGRLAQRLFPGGVCVEVPAWEHAAAMRRTRALLADESVPAIFEAAFEHRGVRIRVDVLERLASNAWGLREVKAASRTKETYLEDVAIQKFVLAGNGIDVASSELIHVNPGFERSEGEIAWEDFFARVDLGAAVDALLPDLPAQVAAMLGVVGGRAAPPIEPALHCRARRLCEFWEHCTADKPGDWILHLPRVSRKQFKLLCAAGIERIPDIPADFALQRPQRHVREALRSGADFVAHGLEEALHDTGPPAYYLDFETVNPPLPMYPGTHPFQSVPFQWSLHREDADGTLTHREFLASDRGDPRRDFAESLLGELGRNADPILVYSPFESRVLENLAGALPDLADALQALRGRLVDLLPIVRNHAYHVGFAGSFSIKNVAPALSPGFGYGDLGGVADGASAAEAFLRLVGGALAPADEKRVRDELRQYCERDTRALVEVHRALRALPKASAAAAEIC